MKYDFRLANEIYNPSSPWMVDANTFGVLIKMLSDIRGGVALSTDADKLNSVVLIDLKGNVRTVTDAYQLKNNENNDPLIVVTVINGVILKSGGMSTTGMTELSSKLLKFDKDPNVIGHLFEFDSGGGSQAGMKVMKNAISQLTKPKVGMVTYEGMAGSAAFGIYSYMDYRFAANDTAKVGSIGTMLSFAGHPNKATDGDGAKHVTIYATKSTRKNQAFEEALNNDDYTFAISEILDPANEEFIADTKAKIPLMVDSQLDGSVYDAKDVLGTMVNEIGTKQEALNKILELSKLKNNFNPLNSKHEKKSNMKPEEILAAHPESYGAILAIGSQNGVTKERERVKSWQTYVTVDPDAVNKGISEGREISASEREGFLFKAASAAKLEDIKSDSPKNVLTEEAKNKEVEKTADEKQLNGLYGKYLKQN